MSAPTTAYNTNGYIPGTSLTPIMSIGLRAGVPYQSADISPGEFNLVDINNQGTISTAATCIRQLAAGDSTANVVSSWNFIEQL